MENLGFDLRQRYDALLGPELPDELGQLASRLNLDGLASLGTDSEQGGSDWASHWRVAARVSSLDAMEIMPGLA